MTLYNLSIESKDGERGEFYPNITAEEADKQIDGWLKDFSEDDIEVELEPVK